MGRKSKAEKGVDDYLKEMMNAKEVKITSTIDGNVKSYNIGVDDDGTIGQLVATKILTDALENPKYMPLLLDRAYGKAKVQKEEKEVVMPNSAEDIQAKLMELGVLKPPILELPIEDAEIVDNILQ